MRRLDRLVLMELAAPWGFGVALFTVLLIAAGPLVKITSFLAAGAPAGEVGKLVALLLPAVLVKTFTMAMLLAGLLGFGRLSSDSEITALKAGGASVIRILRPVFLASLLVGLVTFVFNDRVVPASARTAVGMVKRFIDEGRIAGKADAKPITRKDPKTGRDKLVAMVNARNVDFATNTLLNVVITLYDADERPKAVLIAPQVTFDFSRLDKWRIGEGARIVPLDDPRAVVNLRGGAWPAGVPAPNSTFDDLFSKDDYDAYTIAELRAKIKTLRRAGEMEESKIRDFEYGYWNKFSVAFAALVFGPLGAALGIQNRRSSSASGFALAVGIIFLYIVLANFTNVWAQSGFVPPWVASFIPICIGALACGVIIYRRNA